MRRLFGSDQHKGGRMPARQRRSIPALSAFVTWQQRALRPANRMMVGSTHCNHVGTACVFCATPAELREYQ